MLYCKCSMTLHQHHDIILISPLPSEWCEHLTRQNKPGAHGTHRMTRSKTRACVAICCFVVRAAGQREKRGGGQSNGNGNYRSPTFFFSACSSFIFSRSVRQESKPVKDNLVFIKAPNLNRSLLTISFSFRVVRALSLLRSK